MDNRKNQIISIEDIGTQSFEQVWKYQKELFGENVEAKKNNLPTQNTLLLCEHPHVITIGKNGKSENLLLPQEQLRKRKVELFNIDRGGDITYHGPGQLVAYPIFDLDNWGIGLKSYVWRLEEIMIRLLKNYNIEALRSEGAPGVWLDTEDKSKIRKMGAIGVYSRQYITMHGFALNINTDLTYFSLINPCGFVDRGVTSLAKESGQTIDMDNIKKETASLFKELFLPLG